MDREDRIRVRAYDIWIAEGCPEGRESDHWQQAAADVEASITDGLENTGANPPAEAEIPTAIADVSSERKPRVVRSVA
jgi:hypothetical protein